MLKLMIGSSPIEIKFENNSLKERAFPLNSLNFQSVSFTIKFQQEALYQKNKKKQEARE